MGGHQSGFFILEDDVDELIDIDVSIFDEDIDLENDIFDEYRKDKQDDKDKG